MDPWKQDPDSATTTDLTVLIGVLANVQAALSVDSPDEVMSHLLDRLRRDLRSLGLTSSDQTTEVIKAVADMNARLRISIGEVSGA
ncbi:hypothetical protein COUCH_15420 [Couchioplanes caeruleus]|uniref:hypothetical protein n=1 Tax=Couchioplanes caeruleus TaxID=56438 RepID=UPI0020BFF857|nr:hypothetical protein [Couchioplanes caeruleus]UQU67572.1 hypothetical protein COUCH_15420 [Couchioplanes caeruleus]